ncbi:DinB family protein [Culicoidibacter larvae]|uniref:DinB family protein n=1 Tax=Culicoidibacter larvae TaxID=2579976 RepID=A0A5R8QF98_9FIRM|nr:DinB family protein [Culicoidibacter larvae]TLG76711.1 DinB family protein [Culicoidibacter larvae]
MIQGSDWNPKQARMRKLIRKADGFDEAMQICMDLHASVHFGIVSNRRMLTYADLICDGLVDDDYRQHPLKNSYTIAWNIWHMTRIEDLTMNLLVRETEQVFNADWQKQINTHVSDTGNAMTKEEMVTFSEPLNIEALLAYRNAVCTQTRAILQTLSASDMKQPVSASGTERVLSEGGVTEHPDLIWLQDFWGKKDIAGILLLPITRHQSVHWNDAAKIKASLMKIRK